MNSSSRLTGAVSYIYGSNTLDIQTGRKASILTGRNPSEASTKERDNPGCHAAVRDASVADHGRSGGLQLGCIQDPSPSK